MTTVFPLAIRQPVRRYIQLRLSIDPADQRVIRIRHFGSAGVHGYDAGGALWSTFEVDSFRDLIFSKRGARHCAICGEWLVKGYSSGFIGSETSVCCRHIEWEH